MKQKKIILLGVLVAVALVSVGGRRLVKRHEISQGKRSLSSDSCESREDAGCVAPVLTFEPSPAVAPRPAESVAMPEIADFDDLLDDIEEAAYRLQNVAARGVLLARVEDLHVEEPGSVEAYLALLDLWEEVQVLRRNTSAEDGGHLAAVTAHMEAFLRHDDCEVLCGTEWDPTYQRALRVEYVLPAGSPPRVGAPVSAGLKVRGRLVRKQSVMLRKAIAC